MVAQATRLSVQGNGGNSNGAKHEEVKNEEILVVPRLSIQPFPNQPRKFFNQDKLRKLGNSVKAKGQLVPIHVKDIREEKCRFDWELIDGQRRWHACGIAGKETMRIIVDEVEDEDDQFEKSVIYNFGREDHHPVENALAIKRFRDRKKPLEEIADIFSRSIGWVQYHEKILELCQGVIDMLSPELPAEEQIPLLTALLLIGFPAKVQVELARTIVEKKLRHGQAKKLIRKRGEALGITVGSPDRTPSKDYAILTNFVKRTQRELDLLIDNSPSFFGGMLRDRTRDERANLVTRIEQVKFDLNGLYNAVKRAK